MIKTLLSLVLLSSSLVLAAPVKRAVNVPPADPGTANFKWVYMAILKPKCVSCHSEASNYKSVMDSWVTKGDPENSSLYSVIVPGTDGTAYMPEGDKPIGARGLRAVYWWIKAGAKPGTN